MKIDIHKTLQYIHNIIQDFNPEIGIILGSGLGSFADNFDTIKIPYSDIPGFEKSQIEGHKGQLVFSCIENRNTIIMQGRYHFYEGYSMQTIAYPIKVMQQLGVKTLIVTNAAGAINKTFSPADFMLITDHINFMGTNPLIGKNDDNIGVRFPDMTEIYSKELIQKAEQAANNLNIKIHKGVYAATTGPSYETPAEIKMLSILGADAVGMSTVPETITAKWCGLKILGISCLTNYAAGISINPLSHDEVIQTADKVHDNFTKLILKILKTI